MDLLCTAFGNSVSREKCGRSVHATHRIYAFKKSLLDFIFTNAIFGSIRKLEQLRYLEFGKRIKMVETTHVGNRNRHAGRLRKSEKNCSAFFVIEIAFGFTLVEKKFKKSTMKNRNSKACVCN
jgi:hypothetical protein